MNGFSMFFLLAILGGIVAYVGDRIGMKVGRKRLSIFGLRPKHTSIVITVITGILISAVTLSVMTFVSQDVGTALFRMKEIQDKLVDTENELEITLAELDEKRKEEIGLENQIAEISAVYYELKSRYDEVKKELDAVLIAKNEVEEQLLKAEKELLKSEENLDDVNRRYTLMQNELFESNELLIFSQREIEKLGQKQSELQTYIAELNYTRDMLEFEIENLEKAVADFTDTSILLAENIDRTRMGTVVFAANQVILGRVIDCKGSSEYKNEQINDFLMDLSCIAFERGAFSNGDNENLSSVVFENSNTTDVFEKIDASEDKVVLRAISPVNSIYGEPVLVLLNVLDDEKIYFQGEVIISSVVNGSKDVEDIQQDVLNIIQDVNNAVVAKGMSTDAEGRIGTILSVTEFASVINEISNYENEVMLKVLASHDIWRSETSPLFEFIIEFYEN